MSCTGNCIVIDGFDLGLNLDASVHGSRRVPSVPGELAHIEIIDRECLIAVNESLTEKVAGTW